MHVANHPSSPGEVAAVRINETKIENREILDYDDDRIENISTLRSVVVFAQNEDTRSKSSSIPVRSESELERLLSIAEYKPVKFELDVDVFYVRYEGEVYEIYVNKYE